MADNIPNFSAEDLALLNAAQVPEADATPPASEGRETTEQAITEARTTPTEPSSERPKPGDRAAILEDADDDPAADATKPGEKDPAKSEDDGKPADKPKEAPADNWREKLADHILSRLKDKVPEDKIEARRKAILNAIGRYKSPEDYMTAGYAAQERIRSGELHSKLPDDANDEEVAAWRKENGIPEKASDYDFPKVPGHKWTDADEPLIKDFKKAAHTQNLSQDQVNSMAEWYAKTQQTMQQSWLETVQQTDSEDGERMREQMRAELGADYKPTAALLRRFLEDRSVISEPAAAAVLTSRYFDENGKSHKIVNQPWFLDMLKDQARSIYGETSFIRGDGRPNPEDDVKEADEIMRTDLDRYYREGWDQKAIAAMEKQNKAASRRRAA